MNIKTPRGVVHNVVDAQCIYRSCFHAHYNNDKHEKLVCITNRNQGCPQPIPAPTLKHYSFQFLLNCEISVFALNEKEAIKQARKEAIKQLQIIPDNDHEH